MEFMNYFFRGKEDGFVFDKYGTIHIVILIAFLTVAYLIINKKFNLNIASTNNKLLKTFASIILIDQIVLYLWQFGSGRFSFDISLPLYHCRIAVFFLIFAVFTKIKFFKVMTIFWGFFGSLFALTLPDLYAYNFPHYTNFQFFIVHLILGWVVADLLFVENVSLNKKDLRNVLVFTNIFNLFLICFNFILKPVYSRINYGYMIAMPGGMPLFDSRILHALTLVLLFNVGTFVLYKIFTLKDRKMNTWETTKSLVR